MLLSDVTMEMVLSVVLEAALRAPIVVMKVRTCASGSVT